MIPIGTTVPSRYPPIITWVLIATNCIVFLFEQGLNRAGLDEFIDRFALVPSYTARTTAEQPIFFSWCHNDVPARRLRN